MVKKYKTFNIRCIVKWIVKIDRVDFWYAKFFEIFDEDPLAILY